MKDIMYGIKHSTSNFEMMSEVITFLRFPLIILVVCIHAQISDMYTVNGWTAGLERFIGGYLSSGAVPAFFFISGYLFCRQGLDWGRYKVKFSRRIHTLLIPFLLWSLIAFAVLSIWYLPIFNNYFENLHKVPYDLRLFLMSFIDRPVPEGVVSNHTPLNFPLWYLRDLIILVVFTPLIYKLRRYSTWVLLVLTVICSFIYIKECEYQFYSVLFYSIGVYHFSLPSTIDSPNGGVRILLMAVLCFFLYYLSEFVLKEELSQLVHFIIKILLIPLYFECAKVFVERGFRIPDILTRSTFFVFCIHGVFIGWLKVLFCRVFNLDHVLPEIFLFFLIIIITLTISIGLYCVLQKFTPKILDVLCGGR